MSMIDRSALCCACRTYSVFCVSVVRRVLYFAFGNSKISPASGGVRGFLGQRFHDHSSFTRFSHFKSKKSKYLGRSTVTCYLAPRTPSQVGMGHPLPTPYLPRRLWRLNLGASVENFSLSINQSVNFYSGLSVATTTRTTRWMMSADDVGI